MTRIPLTRRQTEVLGAIREFIVAGGVAPTIRELAEAVGAAAMTTYELLVALEVKGWIRRHRYTARGIELLGEVPDISSLDEIDLLRLRVDIEQRLDAIRGK